MARCPYLDFYSTGVFVNFNDHYTCKLCGQRLETDSPQVKYTCNPECGYAYTNCQIYMKKNG